jgi:hypothetical protein
VEGHAAAAAFSFPFALLGRTGRITAFILGETGLFFDQEDHEQLLHTQRASATIWAGDDGVSFFFLGGPEGFVAGEPAKAGIPPPRPHIHQARATRKGALRQPRGHIKGRQP